MDRAALPFDWRRLALGLIAVALLIATGVLWTHEATDTQFYITLRAGTLRGGLVLAALWLAYPQLVDLFSRFAPSTLVGAAVVLAVVIVRPKAIVYLAPLIAALLILKFIRWLFAPLPKEKPRTPRPSHRDEHEATGKR